MKLNIITVLFKKNFLINQFNSFPNKKNINWILCKTKDWGELDIDIFKNKNINIKISETDCEDTLENFILKINNGLSIVEDGYFYILDDDNCLHENMYNLYEKYLELGYEMMIGKQIRKDGNVYLNPNYPKQDKIDMGNVICTTNILKKVNYFNDIDKSFKSTPDGVISYDGQFWEKCYNQLNKDKIALINETMFFYNGLR